MKKILFILSILSGSIGFASAPNTEFIAHRPGAAPIIIGDPWGLQADLKTYALPVYFGYPIRSYRIIGTVIAHGASEPDEFVPRPEAIRSIVSTAKAHDAEAVIMIRLTESDRLATDADGNPWILAKAIAITWRMDGGSTHRPRP
jgi:hypothetical protein